MNFDLAWEHVTHFILSFVLIVFCGGFLSSAGLVAGGGLIAVSVLHAPTFGIRWDVIVTLYGLAAFLLVHGVTRFWFIREGISEFMNLSQSHRDTLAHMKGHRLGRARA
jgi:phosphotransferase system  glucose/maltose/N-acetylglucosamine-specific IIC component